MFLSAAEGAVESDGKLRMTGEPGDVIGAAPTVHWLFARGALVPKDRLLTPKALSQARAIVPALTSTIM